ncbi:unnamed protein product [Clonostachys rosea]|uniref:Zn(2)-C6 fungal-type domain-containing protein n=1 Tax=Bionectria ochroleuca TaxID=29856 RepID=A0ABY6UCW2_BIOOC|nr:unnamed protein product [Clonostachys rosea]
MSSAPRGTSRPTGTRRNRERLACRPCRERKLKCDRCIPCGSCVRRRAAACCSYGPSSDNTEHTDVAGNTSSNPEWRVHAYSRLDQLESLVETLVRQRTEITALANDDTLPTTPTPEDQGAIGLSSGGLDPSSSSHLIQSGMTHWSAVLEEIQAFRRTLATFVAENTDAMLSTPRAAGGIGVMFGTQVSNTLGIEDVLDKYLPSQRDTDRLVSIYFRDRSSAAPFIHSSQFQRQYRDFWSKPGETSPLWISILFSILHISATTVTMGREIEKTGAAFTEAAAQCLALGEYFLPKAFAIEALLLYLQSQYITSLEIPPYMGSLLSIIVRLATTAGYHREDGASGLSPFVKEMRRRTWSVCVQLDLLISFHMGLPSSIQFSDWNMQPPNNLLDSDFDEDSLRIPNPRPDTEFTGVTFCIMKQRFMGVFEKILRQVLLTGTQKPTNSDVDLLDVEIKSIYNTLPDIYRARPLSSSVIDSSKLIVTRLCISLIYYKCLCVLHRPHLSEFRANSIRECYVASTALVQIITDVYSECTPGGRLETEEWFMKSITWRDLLLGTTTLCLVLCATGWRMDESSMDRSKTLALLETAKAVIQAEQARSENKDSSSVLSIIDTAICEFRDQQNRGLRPSVTGEAAEIVPLPVSFGEMSYERARWNWEGSENGVSNDFELAPFNGFLNGSNRRL